MEKLKINHLAVWILVILFQGISLLWYSQLLFASKWVELVGKSAEDFAGTSAFLYIISIIAAAALYYLMAWLFKELNVITVRKGLWMSFLFWLCFLFLLAATSDLFSMNPITLTLIDKGNYLVCFLLGGILLSTWKRK